MRRYRTKMLEELALQLSAGPVRLRKGYIDAAEDLLGIIKSNAEYPYEFILYKITNYRSRRNAPIEPISGEDLRADLRVLILDLCDSFDISVHDYSEPVYDTAGLAERFGVSARTVRRWRRRGLVARRLVFDDGKKQIAFLRRSVRDFARRRFRKLLRSAKFSRLTDSERSEIIRRARRLVRQEGLSLLEVSRHLARQTGRAVETIRYTIRKHDRDNPVQAVFPKNIGRLDNRTKEIIYRCFLHGVSVKVLAERYGRTRSSIYRIVNEMRAKHLLEKKIEYVYNPQFDLPGAEEIILKPPPEDAEPVGKPPMQRLPSDIPPYLRALYEIPLMSPPQERDAFRRYNYLKYRADQLRKELHASHPRSGTLRRIERLLAQAQAVKNRIIRANLRLVVSIARKHVNNGPQSLAELISDGNVSLIRAVEKFDYSRGFKFSTYASWAIMKNFARSVPKERYRLDRFVSHSKDEMDLLNTLGNYDTQVYSLLEIRESINTVLAQLSTRERSILTEHFGLDSSGRPQSLKQIGRRLGISTEQVRQIERKAVEKLREMLKPIRADLMR